MSIKDLSSLFIANLNRAHPNKKELVYRISDILDIETESAYRRLAGSVKFSINEMGLLAKEMRISIDSLVNPDKTTFLVDLSATSTTSFSMDVVSNKMEEPILYWNKINSEMWETGAIFASLPIEFFMFHPHICKYMYFKWGHYFIATKEFNNYSEWTVPENLLRIQEKISSLYKNFTKALYFWDRSLIPNLANEINYHLLIGILTRDDIVLLKSDLHALLDSFEEFVKGKENQFPPYDKLDFECYITNLSVSITSQYFIADNSQMSVISSSFLHSAYQYDPDIVMKINKWIHSLKKISSLISGGCEKERVVFFRRQHQIIDELGNYSY